MKIGGLTLNDIGFDRTLPNKPTDTGAAKVAANPETSANKKETGRVTDTQQIDVANLLKNRAGLSLKDVLNDEEKQFLDELFPAGRKNWGVNAYKFPEKSGQTALVGKNIDFTT